VGPCPRPRRGRAGGVILLLFFPADCSSAVLFQDPAAIDTENACRGTAESTAVCREGAGGRGVILDPGRCIR
jgi:hypothetical protein